MSEENQTTKSDSIAPFGRVHPLVIHLEDALNRVVLCTDGDERRLVEIEADMLHYEVEMDGDCWRRLSGTSRWLAETLFIGGRFVDNEKLSE